MSWDIIGQQLWNGLLNGSIYVIFAAGLSLVFGVMRVINMAHGELTMLGAMLLYTATSLVGLGYFPGAVLVVAVMGSGGLSGQPGHCPAVPGPIGTGGDSLHCGAELHIAQRQPGGVGVDAQRGGRALQRNR